MKTALVIPENYEQLLDLKKTERAIRLIKDFFQTNLAFELNLIRVTAPLFVKEGTGINDNLNGVEQPVSFNIKAMDGAGVEIVQSLAKWKQGSAPETLALKGSDKCEVHPLKESNILQNGHYDVIDQ